MEWSLNSFNPLNLSISFGLLIVVIFLAKFKNDFSKKRPPGPPAWPILGNLLEFVNGDLPHHTFHKLRSKYGPVLWLKLGSRNTMVIQNATAAAELFKKHDSIFSDRITPHPVTALNYHEGALAMTQYGGYWRVLRRFSTTELMSNKRLTEATDLRRRIIRNMVRWIEEDSLASRARGETGAIHLYYYLFVMTFNIAGNLMFSRDLLDNPKDPKGIEFLKYMEEINGIGAMPDFVDLLFPFFKSMDLQGLKRKLNNRMGKMMKISSGYIQEKIEKRKAGEIQEKKDYVDILLDHNRDVTDGPEMITMEKVNLIVLEMFIAATDTSMISIEFGLAELLRRPHTFQKLQEEIDRVVGVNRFVEESDMENLPYLQAVIKETFRLHPAIPLLFPRKAMEDTTYMGYDIPKGTQVLVNVWGMGRDPSIWEDPLTFKPERFLNSNVDYKGQNYNLLPFGSGRRICIGLPLAHRLVPHALATLVQAFDWELCNGVKPEDIDMDEAVGVTLNRKNPLKIIPKKRLRI